MVNFTVNGRQTTDEEMIVVIPERYKDLFEGHAFESMHDFSMALMFAGCAFEAWIAGSAWKVYQCERDLKSVLAK